jgi:uncharacterized protein with HEPN domain
LENDEKQDAIIRKIEIIGEAAKRLSPEFQEEYSDIPWRIIKGMRDKLVHDYIDIDLEVVWETSKKNIPELEKKINHLMILLKKSPSD